MRGILAAVGLLISAFGASGALAGDTASLNILGYSQDGKIFAFEEYGSYDGSGFAYSNIFFLDIATDTFLPGTPIRVQVDEEESVAKIRSLAAAKAAPLVQKYGLGDDSGQVVVYNPISEIDSDPHKVRYYGYLSSPPRSETYSLLLNEKKFEPVEPCLNMTGEYTGFSLSYSEEAGQKSTRVLHEDLAIPASRNCPNGYRIGAVISSETGRSPQIVMILVSSFGFEGNDVRWIAVPASSMSSP